MEVTVDLYFKVVVYSHFFVVIRPNPRAIGLLLRFCSKYTQYSYIREKGQKPAYKPFKIYASKISNNEEYRFHIGQYSDFIKMLENNFITEDLYTIEYSSFIEPEYIDIKLKDGWKLKDYQEDVLKFIIEEEPTDNHSRLVSLPTGGGKTVVSLAAIAEIKNRTVIAVLPGYIDKWASDITTVLNVKPSDVMTIQGASQLKSLINIALDETLTAKFIIISIRTIQSFYKAYEIDKKSDEMQSYSCMPDDLFPLLKAGTMIIDETHQHLHAVFKMLMYTHISKVIALSATLISNDSFLQKIHHLMFPKEIRFDKIKMDRYIKVYAIAYNFNDMARARIRTTEFTSTSYSHIAFEKSIIKQYQTLSNYLKLIEYFVKIGYIQDYIKGDKLIIYAASIAMCDEITKYLKRRYSYYDIRRYVEQDPYENVIDADIRVTTVLSAGTAVDIPNLRCTIMTNSIYSDVSNLQSLGRLRNLKDRDVKFYYIYCDQIKKQVEFHQHRKALFADRVASFKEFKSPVTV